MSLGRCQSQRNELWIISADLPRFPNHPFICTFRKDQRFNKY